jgi:hypothetical protein
MSDGAEPPKERGAGELEREERRLERLRLVVSALPPPRAVEEFEPDPNEAA